MGPKVWPIPLIADIHLDFRRPRQRVTRQTAPQANSPNPESPSRHQSNRIKAKNSARTAAAEPPVSPLSSRLEPLPLTLFLAGCSSALFEGLQECVGAGNPPK